MERLDRRRILVEDVQKVIHHAEETGDHLVHPGTGHRKASFKPYKTTFWVEYTASGDRYEVHNAMPTAWKSWEGTGREE
jgi:hypothetical protein